MVENSDKTKESRMFSEEMLSFKSDEDIQLYIMHRFNIDADTLDCMPACKEPMQSLLWPKKRE